MILLTGEEENSSEWYNHTDGPQRREYSCWLTSFCRVVCFCVFVCLFPPVRSHTFIKSTPRWFFFLSLESDTIRGLCLYFNNCCLWFVYAFVGFAGNDRSTQNALFFYFLRKKRFWIVRLGYNWGCDISLLYYLLYSPLIWQDCFGTGAAVGDGNCVAYETTTRRRKSDKSETSTIHSLLFWV